MKIYLLAFSAVVALLIMFLTGAPKKGETARICMFICPFLLIPVTKYTENVSQSDKSKLLILIFGQAIVMQLVGIYIW